MDITVDKTRELESIGHAVAGRDVILLGVVGSTSYGLAREGSDRDYLGVFRAPFLDVLGTNPGAVVETTLTGNDPDFAIHEIGKLIRLLTQANPTVTELLWLDSYETMTAAGQRLVESRNAFLSTGSVRSAYLGYATDQARRLTARHAAGVDGFSSDLAKRTAKHGRHCARLLLAAEQLLGTGELTLDVSEHREQIFGVGELATSDVSSFTEYFETERARIESLRSVLPDQPDLVSIETLLRSIRIDQLQF